MYVVKHWNIGIHTHTNLSIELTVLNKSLILSFI